jgi:hypothetical protein
VSVGIKPLVGFSVSGDGGRQGRTEERLADVINELVTRLNYHFRHEERNTHRRSA